MSIEEINAYCYLSEWRTHKRNSLFISLVVWKTVSLAKAFGREFGQCLNYGNRMPDLW